MKKARQILLLMFLTACAFAQNSVQVQRLQVVRDQGDVRIELSLSGETKPSVEIATQPDRIILVLPNTVSDARQQRANVNTNGVRGVRMGLKSFNPPVTHVVIDLNRAHPYVLNAEGTRVILTVKPTVSATTAHRSGPPAAASLGSIGGIFHRSPSKASSSASTADSSTAQGLPTPPTPFPPMKFPAASGAPTSTVSSTSGSSSAAMDPGHPSYGGLQQETVNPGFGSPGTGIVPNENPAPGVNASRDAASSSTSTSLAPPSTPRPGSTQQSLSTSESNPTSVPQLQGLAHPSSPPSGPVVSLQSPPTTAAAVPSPAPAAENQPAPATSVAASPQPAVRAAADSELPTLALRAPNSELRIAFKVKYVAQGAAYLDGGRSAGLAEGMKLTVRESTSLPNNAASNASNTQNNGNIAELEVLSVAETSAVTEIHTPTTRDVKPGDIAYLSTEDQEALVQKNALSATRKYPTVISFTEGDTLDEEAREEVPKPPLPSVNRARGAIGFDYMGTMTHGAGGGLSSDVGMVVRTDITRIGGTYWNMSGYWRGRLDQQSTAGQPTLQDLINRTYHLAMTYDNPQSAWVAGFGRLYLPWASSLDTIDGGYFGHRSHGLTTGIFAGSTPDPTSWDYNPQRRIAGTFVNFEGGSFDDFRYTSTSGVGVSTLNWQVDRPFVFMENGFFYKRFLSVYDSMQADSPSATPATPAPGPGLGRSFLTVRVQPISRLELDFNHTYFRDVPTFDPTLIGTGLLDKYLFQGFSAGARVEVIKHIWVYSDLGRSSRTGDAKSSLNQLYGATWDRLPWFGLRADAHYSRFNSSFADGTYKSFSLSRNFGDFRVELLAGIQNFTSSFSAHNQSRFLTSNLEAPLGRHYFLQGAFTTNRGGLMNYDQWMFTLGYRFDSRQRRNDR